MPTDNRYHAEDAIDASTAGSARQDGAHRNDGSPTAGDLAALMPRLAVTWLRRQFYGLTRADRWHVGIVDRPIETLIGNPTISDVHWLERPRGNQRYVADPFGCPTVTGDIVLVEDFDHRERHGRIAAYSLEADGPAERSGQPVEVASFATHGSYPYLVDVDGEWWCVPETLAAREVRAFGFDPEHLALHDIDVLLDDVALADPTVFEWNGYWWLFGTDADRGANTHLRAWWAEHPRGPWNQHAIDPLSIDVRTSRGAGTPFVHDGHLYRPAQDCSQGYGGAISLNRVLALDPTTFREECAVRVAPDPDGGYPDGTHTISRLGNRFLVDGTRHTFSVGAFRYELAARLRRLGSAP